MSRHEGNVVAKRPQLAGDRRNQRVVVPAREIGATDGTLKQHIADQRQLLRTVKQYNVARGVAGAMDHLQRLLTEADRVAILQPAIGFE